MTLLFFALLLAKCLPRCHKGAPCRHPNRCVCPRGFRGRRCEVPIKVHQIGGPPEPGAGSDPALSSSQVMMSDWRETRGPVLEPFSPHAKGQETRFSESTVKFGRFEEKLGGLSETLLMNDDSRKSPQVRRTAEEATPDLNNLQPQRTKDPDVGSVLWSQAEGPVTQNSLRPATVEPPVAQKLTETQSKESSWRSDEDEGPSAAASLENTLNLEANVGLGQLKSVVVNLMSEDEEKQEKEKKVKSGGAKKQSLR